MNLRALCSLTVPSLSILLVSLYALFHVIGSSHGDNRPNQCDGNINDLQNLALLSDFWGLRPEQ